MVAHGLVFLSGDPEDCLTRADRLERAVCSADEAFALDDGEDLRRRGRMTRDASACGDIEDCRLNATGRRQRRDRDGFEALVPRRKGFERESLHDTHATCPAARGLRRLAPATAN